jgi:hypothetical protein
MAETRAKSVQKVVSYNFAQRSDRTLRSSRRYCSSLKSGRARGVSQDLAKRPRRAGKKKQFQEITARNNGKK